MVGEWVEWMIQIRSKDSEERFEQRWYGLWGCMVQWAQAVVVCWCYNLVDFRALKRHP